MSDQPEITARKIEPTCGVCGGPFMPDLEPPTFSFEEVPDRPGVVRPVLSKPLRVDPESGAMCWCPAA